MLPIKNLANLITASRIAGAVILLFAAPFSPAFWVLYGYCGVSDFADGLAARAMKRQSGLRAKLDSAADTAFFLAAAICVIPAVAVPRWIWICVAAIAAVRAAGYWIGRTFSSLHTYANKVAGVFLFGTPILYAVCGITVTGVILCLLSGFSACEELLITIRSEKLDRDCRGLFLR